MDRHPIMNVRLAIFAFGACSILAAPLAEAQSPQVPRIGFLSIASSSSMAPRVDAFRQGLRKLGYVVVPQFNATYDPNTYSYGLIEIIRAFVAGRNKLTDAEAAEWAEDLRRVGEQGNYFFCLNQYLYVATKSS
jgi:hypothetical protein